jgi:putative ATPase
MRDPQAPLAERLRPRVLADFVGQTRLMGAGAPLRKLLERAADPARQGEAPPSVIFWGPPGCGKTTLARLVAQAFNAEFVELSAVNAGVKDAREIMASAEGRRRLEGRPTLLFVDEIHRFNKTQQDAFLPAVESGLLSLLGATTENPSFSLNKALLSRCRVFELEALKDEDLSELAGRALREARLHAGADARGALLSAAGGDARSLGNLVELLLRIHGEQHELSRADIESAAQKRLLGHSEDDHYRLVSAFQKSVRHSDPDAALYYLFRLLEAGEDPRFASRRLIRMASEDIGLADPQALLQAMAAHQAIEAIGMPECNLALAQATVYLACAPKSNSLEKSAGLLKGELEASGAVSVPSHYAGLKGGTPYEYDHDWPERMSPQEALPEALAGKRFFVPEALGFERELAKRIEYFKKLRADARKRSS